MAIHDPKKAKAEKEAAKAEAEKGRAFALDIDGKRHVVRESEIAASHDRELWLQSGGLSYDRLLVGIAGRIGEGLRPTPFMSAAVRFLAERQSGNRHASLAEFEAVITYETPVEYADPNEADDSPEA